MNHSFFHSFFAQAYFSFFFFLFLFILSFIHSFFLFHSSFVRSFVLPSFVSCFLPSFFVSFFVSFFLSFYSLFIRFHSVPPPFHPIYILISRDIFPDFQHRFCASDAPSFFADQLQFGGQPHVIGRSDFASHSYRKVIVRFLKEFTSSLQGSPKHSADVDQCLNGDQTKQTPTVSVTSKKEADDTLGEKTRSRRLAVCSENTAQRSARNSERDRHV